MSGTEERGGRRGGVRRRNLALVLGAVHEAPLSRAELTRRSGLNRSTIADLVGDLAEHGLVVERDPAPAGGVGRPSPVVAPADEPVAVAVHPEIDAVTVGLVRLGGRVARRIRTPVDRVPDPAAAVRIAAAGAARLLAEEPAARAVGLGAAVPGIVDAGRGLVRVAPHLGWHDVPFGALLQTATGLPSTIANDGGLGARVERLFGAGRGVDDLVYLHGGPSGIGGGVVVGGRPLRGATGHAGEIGHAVVGASEGRDTIGLAGTLESEVSRRRLLEVLQLRVADPDELRAALRERLLEDAVSAEVDRQIAALAVALANAVAVLNPRAVVLGGFLGAIAEVAGDRLRAAFAARTVPALGDGVELRVAALGADLPLIAAGQLGLDSLLADPTA